jgi:hypothetical protein
MGIAVIVVQCKDKLYLCIIKHHAVKAYGEVEIYLHEFLTSALDGRKWSASRPRPITPGTQVGPRASLYVVVNTVKLKFNW